jgi:hypothetical protein
MKFLLSIALVWSVMAPNVAVSETGRIKRKPPDAAEIERIASETAMNDSLLRQGDIVATDRGFFVFRGLGPDGYTFEFSPVPNPASVGKIGR